CMFTILPIPIIPLYFYDFFCYIDKFFWLYKPDVICQPRIRSLIAKCSSHASPYRYIKTYQLSLFFYDRKAQIAGVYVNVIIRRDSDPNFKFPWQVPFFIQRLYFLLSGFYFFFIYPYLIVCI